MIPGSANSLLLASAAAAGGPYAIERSLRFNSPDSAYLSRTPGTAGNRRTWTWAGWVKRSAFGNDETLFTADNSDPNTTIRFSGEGSASPDGIRIFHYAGSFQFDLTTTAQYRDPSAWYHIVVACDTTQATASNRLKLYVNGTQVTAFDTATYPSQNYDTSVSNTVSHTIGRNGTGSNYFNGYLADIHFIDGQALDPSSFGEFDTNGVWQPIDASGLTYGTNGFHLPFSDNSTAAALGTDTSGNGNTWTVNNISTFTNKTLPTVIFDGVTDYLSLASSADFAMGTGDFTAEAYIYYSRDFSYAEGGYSPRVFDSNTGQLGIYIAGDGTGHIGAFVGGTDTRSSTVPSLKTWDHVAICRSGTTLRIFLNGIVIHSVTNSSSVASAGDFNIGSRSNGEGGFPGAISNLRLIKGTALYTANFTPPSSPLSNVTNTKLLCCQSSSSTTTATVSPGTITANGNVSANTLTDSQAGEDSLRDTPVNGSQEDTGVGGEVVGNYATLSPLVSGSNVTLSNGNLRAVSGGAGGGTARAAYSTIAADVSQKWYCEVLVGSTNVLVGIIKADNYSVNVFPGETTYGYGYYENGQKYNSGTGSSYGVTFTTGDIIGIGIDGGSLIFYKNGVSQGAAFTGLSGLYLIGFGSFSNTVDFNFGQRPFAYTAPSGFKALCTTNLAEPTIADGSTVMDVALYTGNGSTQTISGLNFSPDLVWIKNRSNATGYFHALMDTIRGNTKILSSNSTAAEATLTAQLTSFDSNGFSLGNNSDGGNYVNLSGDAYAAWAWDAGSSTVTNNDGSITSQVRANASAGFSVVTYTGNATGGATVGHGLGVAPAMFIVKSRSLSESWPVYHASLGATKLLRLEGTGAEETISTAWNNTAPTSTVFSLGSPSGFTNSSGATYVAYCFAPVAGYSSFGSYTGNNSTDGPFVYTGFRPAWILVKRSSSDGAVWVVWDAKRGTYNSMTSVLLPNTSDAEANADYNIDALSNGFKIRQSSNFYINGSGDTYIYAAFAEHPFQSSRAR